MKRAAGLVTICAIAMSSASFVAVPSPLTGWQATRSHVHPDASVRFVLVIREQNIETLKETALAVSTPGHAQYGRHLTPEQIAVLTAPAEADVKVVTSWLQEHSVPFAMERERIVVDTNIHTAQRLLGTRFGAYYRQEDGRTIIRATALSLPARVAAATAAVLGLHGAPLPSRRSTPKPDPSEPAKVTPTVLAQTYHVGTPYVDRTGSNKQAVAEFQGQDMRKSDLEKFFKEEVPTAEPGDDKVHAFVGAPYTAGSGVEAALDIQFIMGVAPGVKTEFWEWPDNDFCADLHNYTHTLLKPNGPVVNSISYGWQDELGKIGCDMSAVGVVDSNLAKLAAAGISVLISSGDSGSGYTASTCTPESTRHGIEITAGKVFTKMNADLAECCEKTTILGPTAGFTWKPPHSPPGFVKHQSSAAAVPTAAQLAVPPAAQFSFDQSIFHVLLAEGPFGDALFHKRDVLILNGTLGPNGGRVAVHNANGTFGDTAIAFGAPYPPKSTDMFYSNATMTATTANGTQYTVHGRALFFASLHSCENIEWYYEHEAAAAGSRLVRGSTTPSLMALVVPGPNPPPPPPLGNCSVYERVTATGPSSPTTISGGHAIKPTAVQLYPSWPASSPWVTAVGATRFCNQTVGHEEMATDQFGSGGGFSSLFNQSHATWQAKVVAAYVAKGSTLAKCLCSGSNVPTLYASSALSCPFHHSGFHGPVRAGSRQQALFRLSVAPRRMSPPLARATRSTRWELSNQWAARRPPRPPLLDMSRS